MRAILALLGVGFGLAGGLYFVAAAGAMQQMVAVSLMLVGAVLFTGACVVERQLVHDKKLADLHEELIAIRRAIERGAAK
jgi:drug/metabolite transporter (DMT)-like permease